MRGGSWNNHHDNARCANRNRNHPTNRNDNVGFRVCVSTLSHALEQWAGYALSTEAENGGATPWPRTSPMGGVPGEEHGAGALVGSDPFLAPALS